MNGIRGLLPGRHMASRGPALARLDLKVIVPAGVAGGAGHVRVAKGQGKADRRGGMIEVR